MQWPTLCGPERRAMGIISHFACGWRPAVMYVTGFASARRLFRRWSWEAGRLCFFVS
jgi:hypothetical protein